jgi:hypothetical protein
VQREVKLRPYKSFTIRDQWTTTGDSAVTTTFQWLTRAKVTQTDSTLLLEQHGNSLQLRLTLPEDATIEVQDVSEPLAKQDSPNPGVSRIVISISTAAGTTKSLQIDAIPGSVVSGGR